jgi:hypothetical protein
VDTAEDCVRHAIVSPPEQLQHGKAYAFIGQSMLNQQ